MDGVTKYYLYDSEDIIAEYDSTGNLISSYIHGQGIDEPIAMTKGANTYYYTFDGLGTVSELTEESQNVAESYKYDAFGNLQTPPATGNPYTYTGREYEAESGLYYYRARYYDAGVGRFITADPVGFDGGVNFYVYAENNPASLRDSSGLGTCGPGNGWAERLIPDKWWGKYDFTEPCFNHDSCYLACGKTQLQCDRTFLLDMLKECNKLKGYWRVDCISTATVYWLAVRKAGRHFYPSEEERCCNK